MPDKFTQQEDQYDFPYHFLPTNERGRFHLNRALWWGYEYLSYIELIRDCVVAESPKIVLDVGCGNGRLLHELHKSGQVKHLSGVDLSNRAISLARHFTPRGVDFECMDVGEYAERKAPFDVLTMIEVLEHVPIDGIPRFLDNVAKAMGPKSKLFVTVPSKNKPLHDKHYQHFDAESLGAALESHFQVESIEYLNTRNAFVNWVVTPMFSNRLFVLNHSGITSRLYKLYCRKYLHANERQGQRLFATASLRGG